MYCGGAFSSEDSRYKNCTFDEMKDADLNKTTGVVGSPCCSIFVSAWAPDTNDTNSFYSRVIRAGPGHHRLQGAAWLTSLPASRPKRAASCGSVPSCRIRWPRQTTWIDRRLRLALVHRPTAALAADRVPRFRPELGLAIIMLTCWCAASCSR